ncbi:MAG: glycosyltransferase family 2 protein [Roseivirga sp.]|nr:glycosyltransferase family 2 protein [Roseivirga sp.]
MSNQLLSVVIPVYNEEQYIISVLESVIRADVGENWNKEIIIVDDCSTDNTAERIAAYLADHPDLPIRSFTQSKNQGKGAALNRGFQEATGDFILIQDADLEYDPEEYVRLLKPVNKGFADVVYGSRFVGRQPHRILYFYHYMGNRFLTFLSNLFTNLNLTDMEVCYKLFRREYLEGIRLRERGFGVEPELTAKLSRIKGVRIYEVGISYYGRSYEEGKKINWRDGVYAIYCVLKYNIWARK